MIEHKSILSIAIEYGLASTGLLYKFIESYKANKYVMIEKNKDRLITMIKNNKNIKNYEDLIFEKKL